MVIGFRVVAQQHQRVRGHCARNWIDLGEYRWVTTVCRKEQTAEQAPAERSDVANLQRLLRADLLLQGEVYLVHIRQRQIRIGNIVQTAVADRKRGAAQRRNGVRYVRSGQREVHERRVGA